jgi:hypothetical protein
VATQTLTDEDMLYMAEHGAPCKLTHPISCTRDARIAAEFARPSKRWAPGWIHSLKVTSDVDVVDVNAVLGSKSMTSREQEFVVLPAGNNGGTVWLHPIKVDRVKRVMEWRTSLKAKA